ncbi:MAG TPA: DUF5652 family protein, partial [Candidatus Limnocylindria bacterium]|nr:DUF5652 family protein [Candidatus Limnocylindria bacterium]
KQHPLTLIIIIALLVWSAVWKAMALWKAARKGDKVWFVALFLINTAGLLEIFYIFAFSKRDQEHHSIEV